MIRREEARLGKVYRRALLLALTAQVSCSSDQTASLAPDGSADATTRGDAASDQEAPPDVAIDRRAADGPAPESGPVACDAAPFPIDGASYYDGGVNDAAPGCCAPGCDRYKEYACGIDTLLLSDGAAPAQAGCYFYLGDCRDLCGEIVLNCHVANEACVDGGGSGTIAKGPLVLECAKCQGVGRRPPGLLEAPPSRGASVVGDYFAHAAHLEAASVIAFRALARELALHRAPRRLLSMARRAAKDEIRHARMTARIARRHRASPPPPRALPVPPRTLEQIAAHNAAEGCVNETYGALAATWQAAHAQDPAIRRAMQTIARDETRHAALSWALARWAESRLDRAARERVREARAAALTELAAEIARRPPDELVREAGIPPREAAIAMLDELARSLLT